MPEPGKRNERHDLAGGKPAHGRLDALGFARSRRAGGEHLAQITERAQRRAPGQRKTQESCRHHAGRAEPERPLHDGGEAHTCNDAVGLEDRHDHSPAQRARDQHGRADPHPGDGASGEKNEIPGKEDGAAGPGFVVTAEQPLLQAGQKSAARKAFEARTDRRQPLRPELVNRGNQPGETEGLGGAQTLRAFGVQRAQGFSRRDAGREAQLLDIDHLPFHGDRHRDPEHGDKEHPGQHERHRHRLVIDDDVGRKRRDQGAAGGVASGAGRRLHAVVLKDGHRRARDADFQQARPDRKRQDAGRDGDAEPPAGLEADVEVGQRQYASQA